MLPQTQTLLNRLDGLDHDARVQLMVRTTLVAQHQPGFEPIVDELLHSDEVYHRHLALVAINVMRDDARLLTLARDPSVSVWQSAISACGKWMEGPARFLALLEESSPAQQDLLLKKIVQHRRQKLIEALIPALVERFDVSMIAALLPHCEEATLQEWLPHLEVHQLNWRQMALNHTEFTLKTLDKALAAASERARFSVWWQFHRGIEALALRHSEAFVELLTRWCPDGPPLLVEPHLSILFQRHPVEATALMTRPGALMRLRQRGIPRRILRKLTKQEDAVIIALARPLLTHHVGLAALLKHLPPSRRARIFEAVYEGHDLASTVWPDAIMDVLPHALRHREAARMLSLRKVQAQASERLRVQASQPIEQARATLEQAAVASQAEDRVAALEALVRCTHRSRAGMTETLERLLRLRNEQDPVRMAALHALSQVSPTLFKDAHADTLGTLVTDAVEARDLSYGTRRAIFNLVHRIMRETATRPTSALFQFCLEALSLLAGQAGVLDLPRLSDLPQGAERAIVAVLLPWLQHAHKREATQNILRLASALGRRAWALPRLQALIGDACRRGPIWVSSTAIGLWLQAPETRDERARQLLDEDESVLVLTPVFDHAHRRRQSWLAPVLEGRPLRGRFGTGQTAWLPPAFSGFGRWLPRQQRAMERLLRRVIDDKSQEGFRRAEAVQTLAALPVLELSDLMRDVSSQEVIIQEAALGALVWLDRPGESIGVLMQHLDGDRARVAMYAMPRLARLISPFQLNAALRALLARPRLKVTVHKEALRLLGDLGGEESVALLKAQWEKPKLHKDVRIAVLHGLRGLLDHEQSWQVLGDAAEGASRDVATAMLSVAACDVPVKHRRRYARLLLKFKTHTTLEVRQLLFEVMRSHTRGASWSEGLEVSVAQVARESFERSTPDMAWRSAMGTLIEVCRDGAAQRELVLTAEALAAHVVQEEATPGLEHDVPFRQRLGHLCQTLSQLPDRNRRALAKTLDEITQIVDRDASLIRESLRLRVARLDWGKDNAEAMHQLGLRTSPWDHDFVAMELMANLQRSDAKKLPQTALALSARLMTSKASMSRALALTLIEVAGRRLNWSPQCRRHLTTLRQDPQPHVRRMALSVRVAAE